MDAKPVPQALDSKRFDVKCVECGLECKSPKFYPRYFCKTCRDAFKAKQREKRLVLNAKIGQPSTAKEMGIFDKPEETARAI